MKVAFITPGFGGSFYCQNCFRDDELLTSLLLRKYDVRKVPMYLPSGIEGNSENSNSPVFYGAINLYLREKLPFYRKAPNWMEKIFDSKPMLNYAAKKSGSTRATGLEEMTLSMLRGEDGRQASELDHLIDYLKNDLKPRVVHLSNALLLGLAHRIKQEVGAGIICSLQDEHEWVDPMSPSYQDSVWNLMAEKAKDVDLFITASQYYSQRSQEILKIPGEKIRVIHGGINLKGYEPSPIPFDPPVIGYLCRLAEYFGLEILVDAFLKLKKDSRFKDIKLYI
ncbi:glycosyltransferase, partial [Acidobacteriota bacterium]